MVSFWCLKTTASPKTKSAIITNKYAVNVQFFRIYTKLRN